MNKCLSIVLPTYNENANIEKAYNVIKQILEQAKINFELVYVNDGSKDNSWDEILKVIEKSKQELIESSVVGVNFSRNFGKEAAILAGLASASGGACVVMEIGRAHI